MHDLEQRTLDDSSGCHSMPMHTPSCALKLRKILVVFQSQKKARPSPSPEITYRPSVEKLTCGQCSAHDPVGMHNFRRGPRADRQPLVMTDDCDTSLLDIIYASSNAATAGGIRACSAVRGCKLQSDETAQRHTWQA